MNLQTTPTKTARVHPRRLVVATPITRIVAPGDQPLYAAPADPIQDETVGETERSRQDSLTLLHKLVMG